MSDTTYLKHNYYNSFNCKSQSKRRAVKSSPLAMQKNKSASLTLRFNLRSYWCEKRDLNPYGVNHTPLKRARLPVPPLSHIKHLCFVTRRRSPRRKRCKPHAPQAVRFRKTAFCFSGCYATSVCVPPSLCDNSRKYFCCHFCDNIGIIHQNVSFVNPFLKKILKIVFLCVY